MIEDSPSAMPAPLRERDQRIARFVARPSLRKWIVALGVALTAPALFTGFHFDDHIGRFIYSDLPGAARLFDIYSGGYGAANGKPEDAAWMIEQGYAPWWMDPNVLLRFYRPISLWTHLLDAKLWLENAFAWHAHSLLWFGVLLFVATRVYRKLQGPLVGGLAALLFALDHTHALAVGFSTNRYILLATTFCFLSLKEHHRYRSEGATGGAWLAALWYGVALFAGESSAAFVGYLLGYALFIDRARWRDRALSLAPYFAVTVVWRAIYNALGRGARGSDLYIDPARETLRFAAAALERGPALLVGQWFMPPAETYTIAPAFEARALIAFAWLFTVLIAIALWPLLKRDAMARFWATGMVFAIIPMCSGEPNNRMLFAASMGAAGLLAQWWQAYSTTLRAALGKFSRGFGEVMLWCHLLLSPLLMPVNACSLMTLNAINRSSDDVGAEVLGKEAVFVTSPDYFAVRLMRMTKEVEGKPTPERWRALSFGSEQVTVHRVSDRSLVLDYQGGAMHEPGITKAALDLYRSIKTPMVKGQQVQLEGLHIEVLEVTADGRPLRAQFDFAAGLDSGRYRFYQWLDNHFRPLDVPPVGQQRVLERAVFKAEFPFD